MRILNEFFFKQAHASEQWYSICHLPSFGNRLLNDYLIFVSIATKMDCTFQDQDH